MTNFERITMNPKCKLCINDYPNVECVTCGLEAHNFRRDPNKKSDSEKAIERAKKHIKADQSIKADAGKPRLSLVPTQITFDIAQVREYGVRKYGDTDSWKRVDPERYVDALLRHTLAFIKDWHSKDNESGIEHYKHMACNMAFLCELIEEGETQ